ncbi:MAG: type II secretion system protein GspD [Sedimentisphaerales bacterium]|nr:type II secretion system protein GspD [Sedimentisphaerales bacterium]
MYYESKVNEKKRNRMSILAAFFILSVMLTITVVAAEQPVVSEGQKIPVFNCEEDFGIRKALAMLGSMCGKNIVPSPSVDGQLAFRSLRDVTFEEAMDAILGDAFEYVQEGNLIKVYTKAEYENKMMNPSRRVHKVISLYYITAEEAQKLITPVISDKAVIQSSSAAEKSISGGSGGSGGSSSGGGSLGSGGGGDSLAINDTIVLYDFPENIEKAEAVIKSLDVKPLQVLVEATILSAVLDEDMSLGIDWNLLTGVEVGSFPSALGTTLGTPIETTGFAFLDDGLRIGISSGKLQGFISALEGITDVTVLANPKILAVNKQQGSLLIGNKIGYQSQTTQTDGGTTTAKVDFYESGTRLVFRPYIGNDGYIRMEIYPKDSSATLNATTQAPDETTTELQTNIMVKDGETIVIGGLFRNVVNVTRQQVPILGNIPILGMLFSGQVDETQRQEVIVMLTPHIISDPTEAKDEKTDLKLKELAANDELIPVGRRKMAEDHYSLAAELYLDGDTKGAMKHLNVALNLRPSYLEAAKLKERIIGETNPDKLEKLERNVLDAVEK